MAQISGMAYKAIKNARPDLDDNAIISGWDKVVESAPGLAQMDPSQVAQIILKTLPSKMPTNMQSAYEGTTMQQRNPNAPASTLMNQFDPGQIDAANADYAQRYGETAMRRGMGNFMQAAGGGDPSKTKGGWDDLDAYNKLMSIDAQKAKQTQATAGITAAGQVKEQNKTTAEFPVTQGKSIEELKQAGQKTEGDQVDLDFKKRLYDANSIESKMARLQLKTQAAASNTPLPPDVELNKMSVQAMFPYMTKEMQAAYGKYLGNVVDRSKATEAQAITKAIVKDAPPVPQYGSQPTPQAVAPANVAPIANAGGGRGNVNPQTVKQRSINPSNPMALTNGGSQYGFQQFETVEQGIAAGKANLVKNYNGLTLAQAVQKYAPASENNTEAYIKHLSQRTGIAPDQKLDFSNKEVLDKVAAAIIIHEGVGGRETAMRNSAIAAGNIKQTQSVGPTLNADGQERLSRANITSASGQTLPANPTREIELRDQAVKQLANKENEINYNAVVKPYMNDIRTMLNNDAYTGKTSAAMAQFIPGAQQAIIISKLSKINAAYPNVLPEALARDIAASQKAGGFSGALISSLTGPQLVTMLDAIERDVQSSIKVRKDVAEQSRAGVNPSQTVTPQTPTVQSKGSVPTITTREAYDALPKGSQYIRDGVTKIKG